MLLIVHQCFLMTLSRQIVVFKPTLQTTNKFFGHSPWLHELAELKEGIILQCNVKYKRLKYLQRKVQKSNSSNNNNNIQGHPFEMSENYNAIVIKLMNIYLRNFL